eukprot:COSAG06_NODE_3509_length_5256_cov_6.771379_1_plen_176_part_10
MWRVGWLGLLAVLPCGGRELLVADGGIVGAPGWGPCPRVVAGSGAVRRSGRKSVVFCGHCRRRQAVGSGWIANTPAISVRGVRLRWVVFGAELPAPGTCLLGTRVGVVARVRLQVVEMERFGARVGQLTTRGPPFDGRLDVSGLVWDRSAAKAAEWSASLASERAMLSQIDAYVGG